MMLTFEIASEVGLSKISINFDTIDWNSRPNSNNSINIIVWLPLNKQIYNLAYFKLKCQTMRKKWPNQNSRHRSRIQFLAQCGNLHSIRRYTIRIYSLPTQFIRKVTFQNFERIFVSFVKNLRDSLGAKAHKCERGKTVQPYSFINKIIVRSTCFHELVCFIGNFWTKVEGIHRIVVAVSLPVGGQFVNFSLLWT